MKILLINPPSEHEIIGNDLETTRKHSGFSPPLGLMYLKSSLKDIHNVFLLDCQASEIDYSMLGKHFLENEYDVIGITCLTLCLVDVKKTIDLIKVFSPKSKILCGGPHPTVYPEETLKIGADCVVIGEGESVIKEALSFEKKIYGPCSKINDLDSIPFPERTGIDKYHSILSSKVTNSMITSRGCPYHCHFCDRPAMGRAFRTRSAINVVDEIEDCISKGIEEINMYDDTFTINKNRVMQICDEIERRKLKFTWDIRARVNTVNLEMLKRLNSVGCVRIRLGVESGVQRILDVLNKEITLEQVRLAFKHAKTAGMETFSYFMIGNPKETRADIETSYSFSKEIHSDYSQFTILCPFPSTKIYSDWLKTHDKDVWREFSLNPTLDFIPPYWDENFTIEELKAMLKKIYKSFYFTPKFIFKKLFEIRNFKNARLLLKAANDLL